MNLSNQKVLLGRPLSLFDKQSGSKRTKKGKFQAVLNLDEFGTLALLDNFIGPSLGKFLPYCRMFAPGNASKPFVWQSKARKHVKINRNYIDGGHVASCSPLAVGTSDFLTCCALTAPQTTPAQRQSSGNGHPNLSVRLCAS